jgi:ubiquinol-cytochrome c reductase cytochrome b subunit
VLERRCLVCHVLDDHGPGDQSAPDLSGYGTRAWIRGLLESPRSPTYFGKVPGCDVMAEWKKNSKLDAKQLDAVADFVASFARISPDTTPDEWLASSGVADHPGLAPFQKECGTCHAIDGLSEGGVRDAPDLFVWGSSDWIARMIRKPGAAARYGFLGEHRKMPAFGADSVSDNDINMVIRYLMGDYPRPAGVPIPVSVAGSSARVEAK